MGFFTRKKKTAEAATTNIDDDYVAPNIDDIEAAAKEAGGNVDATEGEGNGELAVAVADGDGEGEGSSAVLSSAKEMTRQLSENVSTSLSNINVEVGKIQDDVYVNVSTAAGKIRTTVQDLTKPQQTKEEVVAADENEEKGIVVVVPPEITRHGVAGVQLCIVSGCTNRAQSVVVPPEIIPVNGEDFVMGTVQPPMYKDVKYTVLFLLHFVVMGWWFVDSFKLTYNQYNGEYYKNFNHESILVFVAITGLSGLGMAFGTFGYMLRHGETILKTTIGLSNAMCIGVGVLGIFCGEIFMAVCGFVGFAIVSMYANAVWRRLPFTAANLSVAITAVRDNMGLFVGALVVAIIGFVPLFICVVAGINGHRVYGNWTVLYSMFSYYWASQVITNVMSVATAGVIGRWVVLGEETPTFSTGVKELLARARTYSFGSICFGSLFFGITSILQGLSTFLWRHSVPFLPRVLDWTLIQLKKLTSDVNEYAYVYIGMYGYSFSAAGKNAKSLLRNKGWENVVQYHLAGNILFMANMTIGLLTGFIGLICSTYEYRALARMSLNNPTADGFFVGFLVGFLFSSILMSVVTAAMNTIIICYGESPAAFKANFRDLSKTMESRWKKEVEDSLSTM